MLTSVVQFGYDNSTPSSRREHKSSFRDCEYCKTFSVLEHTARYDTIKSIIATVDKRLNWK